MTEEVQVLKQAQVNLPFVAVMAKGPVRKGDDCRVVGYTLFGAREACNVCIRPHQASGQVQIKTPHGLVRSGLDCLYDVSRITRKKVDRAVEGQVGVAVKVRGLMRAVGIREIGFGDMAEAMRRLQETADLILQDLPQQDRLAQEVAILREKVRGDVSESELQRLAELIDHLTYLRDAQSDPDRHQARVKALRADPHPEARQFLGPVIGLPLESPDLLTTDQVQAVKRALQQVAQLELPSLSTPEVDPRQYDSQQAYHEALETYYRQRVHAGDELRGRLQSQYDLVRFESDRNSFDERDLLAFVTLPCVTPIYVHAAIDRLSPDGYLARRCLEARHRGKEIMVVGSARKHLRQVRTDKPEYRVDSRGKERRAGAKKVKEVGCWFIAYWFADPWSDIYPTWNAYGGRTELLRFPGAI